MPGDRRVQPARDWLGACTRDLDRLHRLASHAAAPTRRTTPKLGLDRTAEKSPTTRNGAHRRDVNAGARDRRTPCRLRQRPHGRARQGTAPRRGMTSVRFEITPKRKRQPGDPCLCAPAAVDRRCHVRAACRSRKGARRPGPAPVLPTCCEDTLGRSDRASWCRASASRSRRSHPLRFSELPGYSRASTACSSTTTSTRSFSRSSPTGSHSQADMTGDGRRAEP